MLAQNDRVMPNEQEVAAKVIDGEAIIMNLNNGVYYSMEGAGGFIWSCIERGYSLEEIEGTVSSTYGISAEQARNDLHALLSQLLEENVVTLANGAKSATSSEDPPGKDGNEPYRTPELHIYRDMGDLLALDPPAPGLQDIPWRE